MCELVEDEVSWGGVGMEMYVDLVLCERLYTTVNNEPT
jgi:hypothetical protein